jgi:curved DNA-binding protein
MDHYQTLGVDRNSSQDDIKKAYRKLAAKHHPDRGGDTATFQSIAQAYDTLSDPDKRAQYDSPQHSFDPFTQGGGQGWHDVSSMFGGNPFEQFFRQAQQPNRRKNRDLNIRVNVNFKQSYLGADLEASYQLPNGKKQTVIIQVPAGVESGQVIRYQGMGDDSIPNLQKGDLNVTVMVERSQEFDRRGNDLIAYCVINPIEAMSGCTKIVNHLNGSGIRFNIRPGVQHGTEYVSSNLGFKNLRGQSGNLIIIIGIDIPVLTDPDLKIKFEELYAELVDKSK